MKLSIITINYNDATGLKKTLESVAAQTYPNIQHVIVDGNSSDASKDIIIDYAENTKNPNPEILWVSEKDKGIYNAMNKGIEIALGKRVVNDDHTSSPFASRLSPLASDYIQILNSGDTLAAPDVTERMMAALAAQCAEIKGNEEVKGDRLEVKGNENGEADTLASRLSPLASRLENCPAILYGNMIKVNAAGQVVGKSGYTEYSLRQFYQSTLNHDCAYIRKDLFEEYGLYDEQLKIVSDWKWYLQAIGLGRVKPVYVDIDVTIFDDGGISETQLDRRAAERRQVLEELLPPAVLWDYDTHAFEMEQMKRLRRWKMYGLVYFVERVLFKLEKWGVLR